MTTAELDALGSKWLAEADAESAPQLTYGFPGATCISVNEEIAHGVPGPRRLAAGDMVNIDVSAPWKIFCRYRRELDRATG
jgi:methionyl aminopeptidase